MKTDDFSRCLRALASRASLSMDQLAQKAGLCRATLFNVQSGKRLPSWGTACKLADALGVSLDDFRFRRGPGP